MSNNSSSYLHNSGSSPPLHVIDTLDSKLIKVAKRIIKRLALSKDGLCEVELTKLVTGRTRRIALALRELIRVGYLAKNGAGVKSDPYRYFIPSVSTANTTNETVYEVVI
ncbi:MAG: hypothetical protein HOO06_13745 [Bdellovibrionaceae bacterium]|jgi:hypothetical protein|nr:hypothetical protein [Pseudobdellovibrionaceae bacterium]